MLSTLMRAIGALLVVSLVSGCGGGGGGGGENLPTTNETPITSPGSGSTPVAPRYATVSGTAAKGILGNATISAYTVNDDGTRGALLGAAKTDSQGAFSLSILAQSSPVWVELTSGTGAFMVCDSLEGCGEASNDEFDSNDNNTVDFGERMPLAMGFALRALLPDASDGTITATISPLTHIAATFAESFPQGIDGLSIAMANSQVANLFALDTDILSTTVPDISSPEALANASARERQYALLLGAFAALAKNGDFVALLQQAANEFVTLQGQLPNRSADEATLSLSRWAEKAIALAEHLDQDELSAAFATLKGIADIAEGETTEAAPDSNISSNELDTAKVLIANVRALKGAIDITTTSEPLPGFSPLLNASNDLIDASAAFSQSSRLGAFVAVPKLALEGACNSISNYFTAYLCRTIVGTKSLEEICAMTLSNLSIGGKTLCEYLNALRLPAGNSLIAELALMDGVASLEGTYSGTQVNMQMSNGVTADNNRVTMAWSGDLNNDVYALQMSNGSISYLFDSLTTFSSLSHPRSIDSSFDAYLSLHSDQVSRFEGSAETSIDLADEDSPITTTELTGAYTNNVGQTTNINLGMSLQSSYGAHLSANFAHPEDGSNVTLALADSDSGITARMQWAGNTINMSTNISAQILTLNNGGLVEIQLNLQEDEETTGQMTYNGKPYGTVVSQAGELVIQLPNGQSAVLF